MGNYPRLDKNIAFMVYSYETLLAEGSTDGTGAIDEPLVVARGMVGYDPEINADVTFPGDPYDSKQRVWDVAYQNGDIIVAEDLESVISGVVLKLLTIRGELEYPPFEGWGGDVYKQIYERFSSASLRALEDAVWAALDEMDRIKEVLGVKAYRAEDEGVIIEAAVVTIEGGEEYFTVTLGGE
ncbi:MAG: hypothetical protein AB7U31_03665 [Synergistaceae bacterium]